MKHEIGYWWVERPEGPEIVYWTGSEAQCFGTDATLREHEISEWTSYEGKAPKPKAAGWAAYPKVMVDHRELLSDAVDSRRKHFEAISRTADGQGVVIDPEALPIGVTSVRLGYDSKVEVTFPGVGAESTAGAVARVAKQIHAATAAAYDGVPLGYKVVEDHEEHGTYQARRDPWGGHWTSDKEAAAKEAWDNLRLFADPLIRETEEKAEKRWKWMVEDAKRARDRLEREHGTWARLTSDEQERVAEHLRDSSFTAWRRQLLADGRWFGLEVAAQTLAESMDKRRAQITKMPLEQDVMAAREILRESIKEAVQQGEWHHSRSNEIDDSIAKVISAARLSKPEPTENPVTVTLIPYDPKHGESATIMPMRTSDEQWRPGLGKVRP